MSDNLNKSMCNELKLMNEYSVFENLFKIGCSEYYVDTTETKLRYTQE